MDLDQQRRYARQIMLADMGEAGQEALLKARVLVIGAGGLGSALISYLAAAGVGTLGIIDPDRVERSNLARQIIHETGDIGRLKVESARDRVAELNPEINVICYPEALTAENADALVSGYDIVADGCDNFTTRFAVNRACVARGTPLVSAAIAGWQGQVMSILPASTPQAGCYQCFVSPDAPEANTCRDSGIIGPLAGILGSMQALEMLNILLGRPALAHHIAFYDAKRMTQRLSERVADAACPVCGLLSP
ncbi:MAG: HesA/MoeB/ThiF family protein [Alphaproteobacteria bacterium]|nr:HesA/MoeB/ThiF family protein [Alphaproteobacteria bacterium]